MIILITFKLYNAIAFYFFENSWLLFFAENAFRMGDRKTFHVNDFNSLI